ncbi:uncharacterized protein K444DRAFT_620247, partial [Hyaloscypha bicolor E]
HSGWHSGTADTAADTRADTAAGGTADTADTAADTRADTAAECTFRCAQWAMESYEILQFFQEDVNLLSSISHSDWDRGVLEDIVKLLKFKMKFLGDFKDLKDECLKQRETPYLPAHGEINSFGKVALALKQAQIDLTTSLRSFYEGARGTFQYVGDLKDNETIPTATLRELIIRERVSQIRYEYVGPSKKKRAKDKTSLQEGIKKRITDEMQKLDGRATSVIDNHKNTFSNGVFTAWRPRTIVVIFDLATNLVLTGATQPACEKYTFWETVRKEITRYRCGQVLAKDIDTLCQLFSKQAYDVRDRESSQIFDLRRFFNKDHLDQAKLPEKSDQVERIYNEVAKRRPTTDTPFSNLLEESEIVCIAFDGFSLKPRAPCIRCQWMYSKWMHYGWPDTPKKKIECVCNGTGITATPPESFSLCAESVAAAKLCLLRTGKLILDDNRL